MTVEIDLARRAAALRRRAEKIPDYDLTEKRIVTQAAEDARLALVEDVRAHVVAQYPDSTPGLTELSERTAARLLDDAYAALCRRSAR